MITTCPACRTRFRVAPEQLDAHGGDVRCGRCAKVFNAHAYLEHEPEVLEPEAFEPEDELEAQAEDFTAQETIPPAVAEAPPADEEPETSPVEPVDGAPIDAVEPEPLPETEQALPAVAEEPVTTAAGEPAVEAESTPLQPVEAISPDEEEEVEVSKKKRSFFWLWLVGALLLLLGLAGQGLYFFRSELAARQPALKPLLQQFCGVLRCSIRLPADPSLLSIETSDLAADPRQANLVTLNAILRNRAKQAQEYPQLELTLTDTQDKMVARRIFPPAAYAKNADLGRGMPPNEELTVKLHLDLGDLKAAGYRVYLFYP